MEDKDRYSIREGHHRLILILVGLGVGLYLIGTTVLIAADGVSYIRRAHQFLTDTDRIIRISGMGYPFLILAFHWLFLPVSSSAIGWAYTAQGIALAGRIGACLLVYEWGRRWIGPGRSFMAVLALLLLPYPARFGADAMRDWPYLLFLVGGMGGLLAGCRSRRLFWFALAGVLSGLGYLIRVEGAQVVLLGGVGLCVEWFVRSTGQTRRRIVTAGILLVVGFFVGGGWQLAIQEKFLPQKLRITEKEFTKTRTQPLWDPDATTPVTVTVSNPMRWNWISLAKSPLELLKQTTECMSPQIAVIGLIGLGVSWRQMRHRPSERFWIAIWGGFQILILVYLYAAFGYISRRHVLPIVAGLCLFIPAGLEFLAVRIRGQQRAASDSAGIARLVWIILAVGLGINVPKLAEPIREDKRGYRQASQWLAENTPEGTKVLVDDIRAGFYSDRPYRFELTPTPILASYSYAAILQSHSGGYLKNPEGRGAQEVFSAPLGSGSDDRVVVYRLVEPPTQSAPDQ